MGSFCAARLGLLGNNGKKTTGSDRRIKPNVCVCQSELPKTDYSNSCIYNQNRSAYLKKAGLLSWIMMHTRC